MKWIDNQDQFKWSALVFETSSNRKERFEKFQFRKLMWNCHTASRQSALVPYFRIVTPFFHSNFLAYWWCSWKWSIGPYKTEKINSIFFSLFQAFEVKEDERNKKKDILNRIHINRHVHPSGLKVIVNVYTANVNRHNHFYSIVFLLHT